MVIAHSNDPHVTTAAPAAGVPVAVPVSAGPAVAGLVVLVVLAVAVRVALWRWETVDTELYLIPWVEELRRGGGVAALDQPISNYTPPYLYLLAVAGYLPFDPLSVVKLVSTVADLALAGVVAALAAHLRPGRWIAVGAGAVTLMFPPVVLNSAMFGQCDAIHAGLVLLALLFVLRERPHLAMVFIGAALAVKLQVVFVLPLLALLVVRRRVPVGALPLVAVGWAAAMLPAVLAGRPPADLPRIYLSQLNQFGDLTLNAANLYQWLPADPRLTVPGMLFAALLVYALLVALVASGVEFDDALVVRAGYLILLLLLLPFTLPRMHERYSYPADVLGIVYAVAVRRGWIVALGAAVVSALSYLPAGTGLAVPGTMLPALAVAEAGIIVLVGLELHRAVQARVHRNPDARPPGSDQHAAVTDLRW